MEKEDDGEFFASLRVGSSQEMTEKQLVTLEKPVREAASNWGWKKTDLFIRHRPLMQIPKQFDDAPFLQTHPNARFVTIEKYRDLFGFRVFAVIFRPGEFQLLFDNTGLKHPVAPPPAQKEKTKKKRWWKRTGSDDSKETPTTALKRYYLAPSTVSNDRTLSRRVYYTVLDRTQQRQVSIQILKHQEYITALEVADWNEGWYLKFTTSEGRSFSSNPYGEKAGATNGDGKRLGYGTGHRFLGCFGRMLDPRCPGIDPNVFALGAIFVRNVTKLWSPETHSEFPREFREEAKCILLMALLDEEGEPRHPEGYFWRLPPELLFQIIEELSVQYQ